MRRLLTLFGCRKAAPMRTVVVHDADGRSIPLTEISIRAVLTRVDGIACERLAADQVRVNAWDVVTAIDDPLRPIHEGIPGRIAGAPTCDRAALRALRDHALDLAARGSRATLRLDVPQDVAGWIALRAERERREYEAAYG